MENLNIPIYRGERLDGIGYVDGYLEELSKNEFYISLLPNKLDVYEIHPTTLEISFDSGKSFIKLSDLEVHTCTDFGLTYSDMKMRVRREIQPANGSIFTVITDKGR